MVIDGGAGAEVVEREAVANALREVGFDVAVRGDLDRAQLERALSRLTEESREQLNSKLDGLIRNGLVPLGISVAAVVFLLSGLYFLL